MNSVSTATYSAPFCRSQKRASISVSVIIVIFEGYIPKTRQRMPCSILERPRGFFGSVRSPISRIRGSQPEAVVANRMPGRLAGPSLVRRRLSWRMGRVQLAQAGFHDLAGRGMRQLVEDDDVVGQHPARKALAEK